eukprot:CAMPEP_0173414970 /NCGR_PEP_ID=MMETSP1356-20130122/84611_1 /TAXON_ID=77927 ORGANISM="Hemiselmis virescens, Strain PCC157" /NCGR_SAMPLE_ID=MMETSP1356 /ASSEMBLY_ACC=CAM_ASM_000847 /LENGTH=168 /DNA_ID=CAMNT_0014377187 /DNA_START=401 /DNA_END=909 /DNA_ORIENTATION=+
MLIAEATARGKGGSTPSTWAVLDQAFCMGCQLARIPILPDPITLKQGEAELLLLHHPSAATWDALVSNRLLHMLIAEATARGKGGSTPSTCEKYEKSRFGGKGGSSNGQNQRTKIKIFARYQTCHHISPVIHWQHKQGQGRESRTAPAEWIKVHMMMPTWQGERRLAE